MKVHVAEAVRSFQHALKALVTELKIANWQSIEMWTDLAIELQEAMTNGETTEQIAMRLSGVETLPLGYGQGSIREFGIADELVDAVRQALASAKTACEDAVSNIKQ